MKAIIKESKRQSIYKIKNSLMYLRLDELDNKLYNFIEDNYLLFMNDLNIKNIEYVNSNSFKLVKDNNSSFSISMIPNSISPKQINIELINMEGNLVSMYKINYLDDDIINIEQMKHLKIVNHDGKEKIQNKHIKTMYKNNKKYNEKSIHSYSGDLEKSCTREVNVYYPKLDEQFIKSQISIGMDSAIYPTSVIYSKYDGISVKHITYDEFNSQRKKININKVLKMKKVS